MNQPPGDDFYNSSTENTKFPPQPRPDQVPGYPPRPQAGPNPYPPQGPIGQPGPQRQQGPLSQPGFGQQNFPQQGFMSQHGPGSQNTLQDPASQPGFGPPNYTRSTGQPGPGPQSLAARELFDQPGSGQPRPPSYPPPSGPISQPGFSFSGRPQQDLYSTQQPSQSGNSTQVPPWEQPQPNVPPWSPQQPQPNGSPWSQQQPQQPPWQQPGAPPNWPNQVPPPAPKPPKKSRAWLVITLVLLLLVVLGGGTFVLFSHKSNNPSTTPTTQNTATTSGVTPVATSTSTSTGTFHGINTPVQAGSDWIATITGVKETSASLIAPNAGSTYLEINLSLKNISGRSLTLVSIIQFTLTDASGHHSNETAADTNIRRPPDGNVNSNQTLAAQTAYEVPKSQHTFVLTFAYGLSDNNGSSIAWQFTV